MSKYPKRKYYIIESSTGTIDVFNNKDAAIEELEELEKEQGKNFNATVYYGHILDIKVLKQQTLITLSGENE